MKRILVVLFLLSTAVATEARPQAQGDCFYSVAVTYLNYNYPNATPTVASYLGSSSSDVNLIRNQADLIATNGFWLGTRTRIPPSVVVKVEVLIACP